MSTITATLVSGQTAVVGVASSREAYEIEVSSGVAGEPGVSVVAANVVGGMLNLTLSNTAVINAGSVMASANTGTITFNGNTIGQLNNNSINVVTNGKEWSFGDDGTFSIAGAIYANGSMGSNGQVLTSTGTSVHWANAMGTGGVSSVELAANLANYQTTAGLSANVAKLAANNTLFLGGIAANQYAYANDIINTGDITFTNTTISTATNNNITISTSQNNPSACPAINSTSSWTFGMDGMLTLPVGGDIRNSNGTSVLGIPGWNVDATNSLIPTTDILQDIGTPSARVRHIYVGPGSVTIGNSVITESTTGKLVLPGVTRATTLFADEVEDTDDQTYSFNSTPSVIVDAYEYGVRAGVETPPGSYVPAEYNVGRLDDDGYIDEIDIVEQGIWTQAVADANRRNPMYAYIGSDINESFNFTNWINVPFVVRSKANDVEYEFNGGGADLGDFGIDGDILEADQMTIKTNDGDIHITSDSDVFVQSAGGNKEWKFDTTGNLKLPQGGDIVDSDGTSVLGGSGGESDRLVNGSNEVVLDSNGNLRLSNHIVALNGRYYQDCGDGTTSFRWINSDATESDIELGRVYSDGGTPYDGEQNENNERVQFGHREIETDVSAFYIISTSGPDGIDNGDNTDSRWEFQGTGGLKFPDNTIQTTAFTGSSAELPDLVVASDTAPDTGILWFNSTEARMYVKYDEQWVDASPTVLTPPETAPTFESVTFNDASVQTTAWTGIVSYDDLTNKPAFVGGGGASTWLTAD